MKTQSMIEKLIRATGKKISYEEIGKAINTTRSNVGYLAKKNSELSEDRIKQIENFFKVSLTKGESDTSNRQIKLDLTDSEMQLFATALKQDKEMFLLFAKALNGNSTALERLKKLLF